MNVPKQDEIHCPRHGIMYGYCSECVRLGIDQPTPTDREAAAERLAKNKYVPWTNAGGPNECAHGRADGISCPECDRAKLAQPEEDLSRFSVCDSCGHEKGIPEVKDWSKAEQGKFYRPKSPAPVGDVEQAELPPLQIQCGVCGDTGKWNGSTCHFCACYYIQGRERQLRAERAAHKATREQLATAWAARHEWFNATSDANHKRYEVERHNRTLEAENQELRRKVEEAERKLAPFNLDRAAIVQLQAELANMREEYEKACITIAGLTAKEGQ